MTIRLIKQSSIFNYEITIFCYNYEKIVTLKIISFIFELDNDYTVFLQKLFYLLDSSSNFFSDMMCPDFLYY